MAVRTFVGKRAPKNLAAGIRHKVLILPYGQHFRQSSTHPVRSENRKLKTSDRDSHGAGKRERKDTRAKTSDRGARKREPKDGVENCVHVRAQQKGGTDVTCKSPRGVGRPGQCRMT